MNIQVCGRQIIGLMAAITVCCTVFAAENAYFSTQLGADLVTVSAPLRYAREVPYVELGAILDQIGGALGVQPEQVQANYSGITALLQVNEVGVRVPGSSFSLIHPIRQQDEAVYIAVSDVPGFFSATFNLVFAQVEQAEQPVELTLTPIEPDDDSLLLMEDALLESLHVPDSEEEVSEPAVAVSEEDNTETGSEVIETEEVPMEEVAEVAPLEALQVLDMSSFSKVSGAIVLDPGHGGQDSGAVGGNGLNEKDLTLAVGQRIKEILTKETAIKVQLTRESDRDVSLSNRRAVAQTAGGTVFISLHAGFAATPRAQGMTIFTDQGTQVLDGAPSEAAKERIEKRRKAAERAGNFGYRIAQSLGEGSTLGVVNIRSCPLLLQRELDMPVVLLEFSYLSNMDTATLLSEEEYQDQVAMTIAWAIANSLKQ